MRSINRIFLSFLSAYIILILIPLMAGILMNNSIVNEYEQHVKRSHLIYLKKTQDVLESFIEDIKWSTYQLAGNTKLLRLISDKEKNLSELERSSLIRETMIELKNSLVYNTSFNSVFYVYLKNQDTIITPYSIYTHSDFNDSVNFFKMEDISSVDWHNGLSSRFYHGKILPVRSVIIEDFKNKRMIPYVQTLPVESSRDVGDIVGAIVYLIGEADFISLLDHKEMPPGSISYIADDNNQFISLVSKSDEKIDPLVLEGDEGMVEMTVNDRKMFIIYTTSSKNNWKYVSILPEKWVMKSVTYYQLISISVMLVALFICLGAAYSLSRRWSKPIVSSYHSISGYLNKGIREKVTFGSLNTNVNELIHLSEDMQDELLNQKVFVHNAFVNRLINGFFQSDENLQNYLNHIGFSVTENHFSIAIVSPGYIEAAGTTESFDEMVRVKNFLKSTLQHEFPIRMMISERENSNLVLILMTGSEDLLLHDNKITEALIHFCSLLPQIYSENMTIALGESVDSLMEAHNSYIQAQDVLSLDDRAGNRILHYKDLDKKLGDFYFPLEMESRLINAVKSGNWESLESLLNGLYSENFGTRMLDHRQTDIFLSGLFNTVCRILSQLPDNVRENFSFISEKSHSDFETIRGFLLEIAGVMHNNKRSHNVSLIEKVQEFLHKNYINKNLSLLMVAEYFSISESYLSFFFKEQTGTNFSTYLEKIRIESAREILINSDEPIHIIAGKVGYNSDKTFRRVFQKTYNISPGKFREEL
jgi:two-component system response regulator YesN